MKTVVYNNTTNAIMQIYTESANWTELQTNQDNEKYKVIDNILYSKDGTVLVKAPSGLEGKITILESVNEIGPNAFYNCRNITEVNMGNNLTKIGSNAFNGCRNITKIEIGNSVTTVGWRAFLYCSSITKLTIGSGVTSIGTEAFEGCKNLKTIIIDSSTIAANLSAQNSYGNIVNYATTMYTKTTPGSYITSNFHAETSDIEGYTKYVKN